MNHSGVSAPPAGQAEARQEDRLGLTPVLLCLQDYLAHIIDQCDLSIRPEQVCALFGNIEDIYEFNRWPTT